jgi:hypothetical protein
VKSEKTGGGFFHHHQASEYTPDILTLEQMNIKKVDIREKFQHNRGVKRMRRNELWRE